jgi:hypothetical protein
VYISPEKCFTNFGRINMALFNYPAFLGTCCVLALTTVLFDAPAQAQVSVGVRIGIAPPPLRIDPPHRHRHGYIWIPGFWNWNGQQHVWIDGYWEIARPGYAYVPARWVAVDGQWVFYPGYWSAGGVASYVEPVIPPVAPAPVAPATPAAPSAPVPPGQDPNFSYYCKNPDGYYPAIPDCPVGWQRMERR